MIVNISKDTVIVEDMQIADTFFSRLKGLLGTNSLPLGRGLVIRPCNSVHTWGMRYPLDVLFVDKNNVVLKVVCGMSPGRIAWCTKSAYVVELPAGTVVKANIEQGDSLRLSFAV